MRRLALLAVLVSSPPAWADWNDLEPDFLSNQLSVAIALQAHDVDVEGASALVASTTNGPLVKRYDRWRGREHLETTQATTVALMDLGAFASADTQQSWSIEAGEICTSIRGAGVPVTHTRLQALSPFDPPSDAPPSAQIFRGSGEDGDKVLTWLQPGEQVTMVQAVSRDERKNIEHIELMQRQRRLTLTRDAQGSEACYQAE